MILKNLMDYSKNYAFIKYSKLVNQQLSTSDSFCFRSLKIYSIFIFLFIFVLFYLFIIIF